MEGLERMRSQGGRKVNPLRKAHQLAPGRKRIRIMKYRGKETNPMISKSKRKMDEFKERQ